MGGLIIFKAVKLGKQFLLLCLKVFLKLNSLVMEFLIKIFKDIA